MSLVAPTALVPLLARPRGTIGTATSFIKRVTVELEPVHAAAEATS